MEEIPHFCFTTFSSNILKHIGMGEKNYLINGKKKPRALKIETTESVGSQLHTALASHEAGKELWHHHVLRGLVE